MTIVKRIALSIALLTLAAACSKKMSSAEANPPPATDASLTGYYQATDVTQIDDEGTPTRLHIFINQNGMQEIEFCSQNGSRGFATWDDGTGARHFGMYPYVGKLKKFDGVITRVDEKGLQLNDRVDYSRYQPTTNELTCVD